MPSDLSAILLAAGKSTRMGHCKQLLPLAGQPTIVRCIQTLVAAGITDIVVVTGANRDAIAAAIGHLPVRIVVNPDPDGDMASSIITGLEAVPACCRGVMICLADQPLVSAESCRRLLEQHGAAPGQIAIPFFEGKRGHPLVLPLSMAAELETGVTLRDIISRHQDRVQLVEVSDRGVLLDMDTPEDYRLMQEAVTTVDRCN